MTLPMRMVSAVAVTAAVLTANTVRAQPHDYAILETPNIPSDANSGESIWINTYLLSVEYCNSTNDNFVNHEMWYITCTSSSCINNGSPKYWVEVGIKSGATSGSGCVYDTIFWA